MTRSMTARGSRRTGGQPARMMTLKTRRTKKMNLMRTAMKGRVMRERKRKKRKKTKSLQAEMKRKDQQPWSSEDNESRL